jgi:Family of unknown function (DUF6059)
VSLPGFKACLQTICQSIILYGGYWAPTPPELFSALAPAGDEHTPPPPLAGIAPSHPERLLPASPLSPMEQRLLRELPHQFKQLSRRLSPDHSAH